MMSSLNYEQEISIGIDLDNFSIEEEIAKYQDDNFAKMVNYNVLVRQYISSPKTKGGLYIPEKSLQNERYDSCIGLVVKTSPLAYDHPDFEKGSWCEVGEWVLFSTAHAQSRVIYGNPCYFVQEKGILLRDLKDLKIFTKKIN